jgi:uncharacterized RDD family membrane protein YckC
MDNPDHSKWSLNALNSWLENHDDDTQPQLKQEIQTQIRIKTRALERDKEKAEYRSITKYRSMAFSFDLIFAYGPYLLCNALLVYPGSSLLLDVFGLVFFVSYFIFFEGYLAKPSPGKRLFRLTLVDNAGLPPKFTSILLRTAIMVVLFSIVEWPYILPELLDLVIRVLLYSALIYSTYLALFSTDKLQLVDVLSKTSVCHAIDNQSPEDIIAGINRNKTPMHHHGIIVAGLFCALLLFLFVG